MAGDVIIDEAAWVPGSKIGEADVRVTLINRSAREIAIPTTRKCEPYSHERDGILVSIDFKGETGRVLDIGASGCAQDEASRIALAQGERVVVIGRGRWGFRDLERTKPSFPVRSVVNPCRLSSGSAACQERCWQAVRAGWPRQSQDGDVQARGRARVGDVIAAGAWNGGRDRDQPRRRLLPRPRPPTRRPREATVSPGYAPGPRPNRSSPGLSDSSRVNAEGRSDRFAD
jgi:hypothetical protein